MVGEALVLGAGVIAAAEAAQAIAEGDAQRRGVVHGEGAPQERDGLLEAVLVGESGREVQVGEGAPGICPALLGPPATAHVASGSRVAANSAAALAVYRFPFDVLHLKPMRSLALAVGSSLLLAAVAAADPSVTIVGPVRAGDTTKVTASFPGTTTPIRGVAGVGSVGAFKQTSPGVFEADLVIPPNSGPAQVGVAVFED